MAAVDGTFSEGLADPSDLHPPSVGARLAAERVRQGRSLVQVADETRIPLRHLHAIEAGDFAALPSPTYAVGFVRAFGRSLDMDEVALAAQVRDEMDLPVRQVTSTSAVSASGVPQPERIPPRAFVWTTVALFVLVLGGYLLWRASDDPAADLVAATDTSAPTLGPASASATAPAAAPAPAAGPVVLTATDEVWLQVRTGAGDTLVSRTLTPGERFEVPPAAADPSLTVGRPEALTVTVGGREVPPLGPAGRPVSDVSLAPAALLALRPADGPDA